MPCLPKPAPLAPVARGWFMPMAHLLFSTTKMQGSLYSVAMLSDS